MSWGAVLREDYSQETLSRQSLELNRGYALETAQAHAILNPLGS